MAYIGKGLDNGVRNQFVFAATQGQTSFSGADSDGKTLAMTDILYTDCYQNGVKLKPTTDYTVSSTTLTLISAASLNDVINIVSFDIFAVPDTVPASTGGTFGGGIAAAGYSSSTAGTSNYIAGVNAGNSIQSGGNYNTVVGDEAGTAITTGDNNVGIGSNSLALNTTGTQNTAVGAFTLDSNTTADDNTAVGGSALGQNTTGASNTAVGRAALTANTTASNNTAMGYNALTANTTGAGNTAIGRTALENNTTAADNVAVGKACLAQNTTGANNTALGSLALNLNTTGEKNVALGYQALTTNVAGDQAVAIGHEALKVANPSGNANLNDTAVGFQAGLACTTGSKNVFIGSSTGYNLTTGSTSIYVGYNSTASAVNITNEIVIGSNAAGGGTNTARFQTTGGSATLGLDGSDTSWAAASDSRLKKDVASSTVGLNFIKDLRPVTFKWNAKNAVANSLPQYDADSSDPVFGEGKAHHGFIAQEVKTVIDAHSDVVNGHNLWSVDPDGTQQVAPSALVPMLTKALQELSEKNDALTTRITALEAE